jgi:hypothetical protein
MGNLYNPPDRLPSPQLAPADTNIPKNPSVPGAVSTAPEPVRNYTGEQKKADIGLNLFCIFGKAM